MEESVKMLKVRIIEKLINSFSGNGYFIQLFKYIQSYSACNVLIFRTLNNKKTWSMPNHWKLGYQVVHSVSDGCKKATSLTKKKKKKKKKKKNN